MIVAELPDKTALTLFILAARKNPRGVFLGAALAYLIQTIVAIAFGGLLSYLPPQWVALGTAVIFLVFAGVLGWRSGHPGKAEIKRDDDGKSTFWSSTRLTFLLIFVAEWGDLTQLATVALNAKYQKPVPIFAGSLFGLWAATALVIYIGYKAKDYLKPTILSRIAAVIMAAVGLVFLFKFLNTLEFWRHL